MTRRPSNQDEPSPLAWTYAGPGEDAEAAAEHALHPEGDEAVPPAPPPETEEAAEARRRTATNACAILAGDIADVWALDPEAQPTAVIRLAAVVADLGFAVCPLRDYPRAVVRLLRLLVRYRDVLPEETAGLASASLMVAQIGPQPEVPDLLLEVAAAGDGRWTFCIDETVWQDEMRRAYPRLGAALGALLDDERSSFATRRIAAQWLAASDWPETAPSLRRALRSRSIGLRAIALDWLVSARPTEASWADDVLFLLEDATIHPLPDELDSDGDDDAYRYTTSLHDATVAWRPPGGAAPLIRIAEDDCVIVVSNRTWLNDGWALNVLAAAYPEEARGLIDIRLRARRSFTRYHATEAAAYLPEAEARPRLLESAADPHSYTAEKAREQYLEVFGEPCPVSAERGLFTDLLPQGTLSDVGRDRMTVLRGPEQEARLPMLEVLLGEAPDREALVLILFALGDDTLVIDAKGRPALPKGEEGWVKALSEKFGDIAVSGLLQLDVRYSEGARYGWGACLAMLTFRGELPKKTRGLLRRAASDWLPLPGLQFVALAILSPIGAPPALFVPLLALALEDGGDERWLASNALERAGRSASLDAQIREETARADAAGDRERFVRACALGTRRRIPAVMERAGAALRAAADDEAGLGVMGALRCGMPKRFLPSRTWVLASLEDPASPRFELACDLLPLPRRLGAKPHTWLFRPLPASFRSRLEAALGSDARAGRSAARAAVALVACGALPPADPRLARILDTAPLDMRGALLEELLDIEVSVDRVRSHVEAVLLGGDSEVARALVDALVIRGGEAALERRRPFLREILPRIPDPDLRATIEDWVDAPPEAADYWLDPETEEAPA